MNAEPVRLAPVASVGLEGLFHGSSARLRWRLGSPEYSGTRSGKRSPRRGSRLGERTKAGAIIREPWRPARPPALPPSGPFVFHNCGKCLWINDALSC
jgi:hypothetical protein